MKKLKYIPIEKIGSHWLIYKDWTEDAIYLLKERSFHPINYNLSSLPLNLSSSLEKDFKLYHAVWEFSLYEKDHPVRENLINILKSMRIDLAVRLFQENPFINTYIENDLISYDLGRFWWDGFLKINSGEFNMQISYEEFREKNDGFIIMFEHLATPFWKLKERSNMSLLDFQGWLDSNVLNELIDLSLEWESQVNSVDLESSIDEEYKVDRKNKPKVLSLARKIKQQYPDLKIYIQKCSGESAREHHELEEV